jgi:hypothetical protein
LAKPSVAEYWHIGEMAILFFSVILFFGVDWIILKS